MNSITFIIDKVEVERIAGKKLSFKEAEEVFSTIENDAVLWDDIEEATTSAVEFLKNKKV